MMARTASRRGALQRKGGDPAFGVREIAATSDCSTEVFMSGGEKGVRRGHLQNHRAYKKERG